MGGGSRNISSETAVHPLSKRDVRKLPQFTLGSLLTGSVGGGAGGTGPSRESPPSKRRCPQRRTDTWRGVRFGQYDASSIRRNGRHPLDEGKTSEGGKASIRESASSSLEGVMEFKMEKHI